MKENNIGEVYSAVSHTFLVRTENADHPQELVVNAETLYHNPLLERVRVKDHVKLGTITLENPTRNITVITEIIQAATGKVLTADSLNSAE